MNKNTEKTERVFVYGTLLRGGANEHVPGAGVLDREPCLVHGELYDTGWGYPAIFPDPATWLWVAGEVLTVTPAALARMDLLEGVPRLYQRKRVKYYVAKKPAGEAWVYVMRDLPAGARVIKERDWRLYTSRINK